jgi:hypothetical protein
MPKFDPLKLAGPLKLFGFETHAPAWVLTLFALILVAGAGVTVYNITYGHPEQQLLSLKDANKQLAAEVEEYSLHAMEEPEKHELFEEQDGLLLLRVFKDHCVLIQRRHILRGVRSKLVIDLARSTPLTSSRQIDVPPPGIGIGVVGVSLFPIVEASQSAACKRGCRDPHPGDFRWWYGKRDGEWVEVWRQWPDNCTHVQMFHPRSGAWDSEPNGAPRVRWVCCVH